MEWKMKNKQTTILLLIIIGFVLSCRMFSGSQSNSSQANSSNANSTTTAEMPKNPRRAYIDIKGDDIQNLNKGLTPSAPCGYLANILKKSPSRYAEYKGSGSYDCRTEFPMVNGSSFSYSASGNKDYISVLEFKQLVGGKNTSDQSTKMLALEITNIEDVLQQATGQKLPKEVTDAFVNKTELKYVFEDASASKPRAYQLKVFFLSSGSNYVMIYFE